MAVAGQLTQSLQGTLLPEENLSHRTDRTLSSTFCQPGREIALTAQLVPILLQFGAFEPSMSNWDATGCGEIPQAKSRAIALS
jgi:hypothetical protein